MQNRPYNKFLRGEPRKCPNVGIPLCQMECFCRHTRFNNYINQWVCNKSKKEIKNEETKKIITGTRDPYSSIRYKEEQQQKQKEKEDAATAAINESIRKYCCIEENNPTEFRPDPCEPKYKEFIPEPPKPTYYLTTTDFKRVSPEFYKMLKPCDCDPPTFDNPERKPPPIQKRKPKPVQISCTPWENYLRYMMDSDDQIYLHGLDFDYVSEFQTLVVDPFELVDLLTLLRDDKTLTNQQLKHLIHMMVRAAALERRDLVNLLRAIYNQGLLTPVIVDYLRKLIVQAGTSLTPKQAKTLLTALARPAEYSSDREIDDEKREDAAIERLSRCAIKDAKRFLSEEQSADEADQPNWNENYPWYNIQNLNKLSNVQQMPEVSDLLDIEKLDNNYY